MQALPRLGRARALALPSHIRGWSEGGRRCPDEIVSPRLVAATKTDGKADARQSLRRNPLRDDLPYGRTPPSSPSARRRPAKNVQ
jgi:hypothetical protein